MDRRDSREAEDETLVVWALLGSLEAFDELVRRYRPAVVSVARQVLGEPDLAEDVAQECLLLAFKALPQLREPSRFAGWLCAITRRRALRVSEGERRSVATEASALDRLLVKHSRELGRHPAEEALRGLEDAFLRHLVARAPEPYRLALELRYLEGWPVARIASFLSLPVTTVKWRLHQGLSLLRRQVEQTPEVKSDG